MPPTLTRDSYGIPRVAPTRELVPGGYPRWGYAAVAFSQWFQRLPKPGDDLEQDFGPWVYWEMMKDPTVYSLVWGTVRAACSDFSLTPPVTERDQANFGKASEMLAFVDYCLRTLTPILRPVVEDVASTGLVEGYCAAEKVYRGPEEGELEPYPILAAQGRALLLSAVKPKARESLSLVVDPYWNHVGYDLAVSPYTRPLERKEPDVPRSKMLHFVWGLHLCDPRGSRILRALYFWWWTKMQAVGELLKFLAQFASPSLAALIREGAPITVQDYDESGNEVTVSLKSSILTGMLGWANGTAAVFRDVAELIPIEMKGGGEGFLNTIAECDGQMTRGFTGQKLANSESQFGTRAQATVHQDKEDDLVDALSDLLTATLQADLVNPLVELNYGKASLFLAPKIGLTKVQPEDRARLIQAFAAMKVEIPEEAWEGVYQIIGVPLPPEGWLEERRERAASLQSQPGQPGAGGDEEEEEEPEE